MNQETRIFQVWFKNRRAKQRKQKREEGGGHGDKEEEHGGGSKLSASDESDLDLSDDDTAKTTAKRCKARSDKT